MDEFDTVDIGSLNNKELGRLGEDAAARYLEETEGLTVLRRNWVCAFGEADIVAQDVDADPGLVILVEVKTRLRRNPAAEVLPEVSVTEEKRRRYARIALKLLTDSQGIESVRFDVAAVIFELDGSCDIKLFRGAYASDDE